MMENYSEFWIVCSATKLKFEALFIKKKKKKKEEK